MALVGGLVFIAEDAQGRVEEGILISKDKRIKGVEVAALGGVDKSWFIHGLLCFVVRFAILNSSSRSILTDCRLTD